jgi:hypothetical protein
MPAKSQGFSEGREINGLHQCQYTARARSIRALGALQIG